MSFISRISNQIPLQNSKEIILVTVRVATFGTGAVVFIGSLVAAGLFFPQINIASIAIVGSATAVSGALFALGFFLPQLLTLLKKKEVSYSPTSATERFGLAANSSRTGLCHYSLIEQNEEYKRVKALFAEEGYETTKQERAAGILEGMTCGDALGSPLEFLPYKPAGYQKRGKKIGMQPGAITGASKIYSGYSTRFHLKPGQWTDDASMGLCLADQLIETRGQLDGKQLMWAFKDWWERGYNNAFTNPPQGSVGLGGNISESFDAFNCGRHETGDYETPAGNNFTSGNGSLMRNGSVAIVATTIEEAMELAWKQSKVTHQGEEAAACCQLMAYFMFHALHSKEEDPNERKKAVFSLLPSFKSYNPDEPSETCKSVNSLAKSRKKVTNPHPKATQKENWNWLSKKFTYNSERARAQPGYIGSYSMDALAMALHCVYTTDSFEDAVIKAVRSGGDADSVGAITGQLAGSLYGAKAIPKKWRKAVGQWDRGDIIPRALILDNIRENN